MTVNKLIGYKIKFFLSKNFAINDPSCPVTPSTRIFFLFGIIFELLLTLEMEL